MRNEVKFYFIYLFTYLFKVGFTVATGELKL